MYICCSVHGQQKRIWRQARADWKGNKLTLKAMKTAFTLCFGPFPVKNDNFRSRGVTSGIVQFPLVLSSRLACHPNTGL